MEPLQRDRGQQKAEVGLEKEEGLDPEGGLVTARMEDRLVVLAGDNCSF